MLKRANYKIFMMIFFSVGFSLTSTAAITNYNFLVLYSNDVQGEIEPCG